LNVAFEIAPVVSVVPIGLKDVPLNRYAWSVPEPSAQPT
jgi:hypothetical protein